MKIKPPYTPTPEELRLSIPVQEIEGKKSQRGITTEMVGSLPVNRAFDKGWNPHE